MRTKATAFGVLGLAVAFGVLPLGSCGGGGGGDGTPSDADPPEVVAGERLFLETRFSQFFFANGSGVNVPLASGDPVMDTLATLNGSLGGPFAGQSMNCRQCHIVDDALDAGGTNRSYADFARRSPIPARSDGLLMTPRNSQPLVNASLSRTPAFLQHFDGEFATTEELVKGTLTGRNFGWLADEAAIAKAHIVSVIRQDDGTGDLAGEFGNIPYMDLLRGAKGVPAEFKLPSHLRLSSVFASDDEIFDLAAKLIAEYVKSLEFARDDATAFSGSPYDVFLAKNGLPAQPDPGETDLAYSRRLRGLVQALVNPVFVTPADGQFTTHTQPFAFGALELQGLLVFFFEPPAPPVAEGSSVVGTGNCIACHHAPVFTDFLAHNVGVTQAEYDALHGSGAFAALSIPDLATRDADPDAFLPPSAMHPAATGVFRSVPDFAFPARTDLGTWNVVANPDLPLPQSALTSVLCEALSLDPLSCTPATLLPLSIATFKTPGLRDLGHSAPYMHTGQFDEIENVLDHYEAFSLLAQNGQVRNADTRLAGITIAPSDKIALAAFLRALFEDYD